MSNEQTIRDIYDVLAFDTNEERAVAYGVHYENNLYDFKEIKRSSDIYDLIDDLASDKHAQNFDFVSLITYGWAAPISDSTDKEIPPSKADNRRRIRLMMVGGKANNGLLGSALKFSDEEEVIVDEDNANGPLASAFESIYE